MDLPLSREEEMELDILEAMINKLYERLVGPLSISKVAEDAHELLDEIPERDQAIDELVKEPTKLWEKSENGVEETLMSKNAPSACNLAEPQVAEVALEVFDKIPTRDVPVNLTSDCDGIVTSDAVYLGSYGVDFALKNMEYNLMDDSAIKKGLTLEDPRTEDLHYNNQMASQFLSNANKLWNIAEDTDDEHLEMHHGEGTQLFDLAILSGKVYDGGGLKEFFCFLTEMETESSVLPLRFDGSLCIMAALSNSQHEERVTSPSLTLGDFLGGKAFTGTVYCPPQHTELEHKMPVQHRQQSIQEGILSLKYLIPGLCSYGFLQCVLRFMQTQTMIRSLVHCSLPLLGFYFGIAYDLVHVLGIEYIDSGTLCNLRALNLSSNNIPNDVSALSEISYGCAGDSLELLHFSGNYLAGSLSDGLAILQMLPFLVLDNNLFRSSIPPSVGHISTLSNLLSSHNMLHGPISESVELLFELRLLLVSYNSLSGVISELHFVNLSKLALWSLSSNSLMINMSLGWILPFRLRIIGLSLCKIGPQFPPWLQTQNTYGILDFSCIVVDYIVPEWLWIFSQVVFILDLSRTQTAGNILATLKSSTRPVRALHFHKLDGPLAPVPTHIEYLDFSSTSFSEKGDLKDNGLQPVLQVYASIIQSIFRIPDSDSGFQLLNALKDRDLVNVSTMVSEMVNVCYEPKCQILDWLFAVQMGFDLDNLDKGFAVASKFFAWDTILTTGCDAMPRRAILLLGWVRVFLNLLKTSQALREVMVVSIPSKIDSLLDFLMHEDIYTNILGLEIPVSCGSSSPGVVWQLMFSFTWHTLRTLMIAANSSHLAWTEVASFILCNMVHQIIFGLFSRLKIMASAESFLPPFCPLRKMTISIYILLTHASPTTVDQVYNSILIGKDSSSSSIISMALLMEGFHLIALSANVKMLANQKAHYELCEFQKKLDSMIVQFRKLLVMENLDFMGVFGITQLVELAFYVLIPTNWLTVSRTQKVVRHQPPEVLAALAEWLLTKEELAVVSRTARDTLLLGFGKYYAHFQAVVQALAVLDYCIHLLSFEKNLRIMFAFFCHPVDIHIYDGFPRVFAVHSDLEDKVNLDGRGNVTNHWDKDSNRDLIPRQGKSKGYKRGQQPLGRKSSKIREPRLDLVRGTEAPGRARFTSLELVLVE